MNKKGKFIEVVGIRTYEVTEDGRTVTKWVVKYLLETYEVTEDGRTVTKWVVKYLLEFEYPRKDGTTGKQQILAEVTYDKNPEVQVGPVYDPNIYEMQLYFKVRRGTSKKGEPFIIQDIILQKASQSII